MPTQRRPSSPTRRPARDPEQPTPQPDRPRPERPRPDRPPVPLEITRNPAKLTVSCSQRGSGLRTLQAAAAALHAILMIVVATAGKRQLIVELYVFDMDSRNRESGDWLVHPTRALDALGINLVGALATYEGITALFHFLCATALWPLYRALIHRCQNPLRWLEYSITAPIMIFLLAVFTGVVNFYVIVLLAALTHVTMYFGLLTEVLVRPVDGAWAPRLPYRLLPHLLGYVPQLVVWVILVVQFVRYARTKGTLPDGSTNQMPSWVYGVFVAEIILFLCFAAVQLALLLTRPRYYVRGEVAYTTLSFVSKATLSLIVLVGMNGLSVDNRG